MKKIPVLLLSLLVALRVQAITVAVPGEPVREMHIFGGTDVPMELSVGAPQGATVEVRADLWQLSAGLAAPLRKDIVVNERPLSFAGTTQGRLRWTIPVPEVQRVTRMAIRFRARSSDDPSWVAAGNLTLVAYPTKSLEWEKLTNRADFQLAVFGPAESPLRQFLKTRGLAYKDLGTDPPGDLPRSTLVVGEIGSANRETLLGADSERKGALVLLCPGADVIPMISTEAHPGFCVTKITASLLDHLSVDPRAQKTLADALSRTLDLASAP